MLVERPHPSLFVVTASTLELSALLAGALNRLRREPLRYTLKMQE